MYRSSQRWRGRPKRIYMFPEHKPDSEVGISSSILQQNYLTDLRLDQYGPAKEKQQCGRCTCQAWVSGGASEEPKHA